MAWPGMLATPHRASRAGAHGRDNHSRRERAIAWPSMAQIVLGLCSSHSPQLNTPSEVWPDHGSNDQRNPWLIDKTGRKLSYAEALEQADPRIGREELTPEKHAARHQKIQ